MEGTLDYRCGAGGAVKHVFGLTQTFFLIERYIDRVLTKYKKVL